MGTFLKVQTNFYKLKLKREIQINFWLFLEKLLTSKMGFSTDFPFKSFQKKNFVFGC